MKITIAEVRVAASSESTSIALEKLPDAAVMTRARRMPTAAASVGARDAGVDRPDDAGDEEHDRKQPARAPEPLAQRDPRSAGWHKRGMQQRPDDHVAREQGHPS